MSARRHRMLCDYSDIFGKPKTGVHSARLGGMAAVDLLGTIAVGAAIGWWRGSAIVAVVAILLLLVLSVIAHSAFCVNTPLTMRARGVLAQGPTK